MCGIGGILRTDGQPIPEEWLDIIDARIAYRGPDGHGRFRDRVEIDVVAGTPALRAGRVPVPEGLRTPGSENRATTKRVVEVAFVHRRLSIIDHAGGHQPMVSERGRNDSEGLVAVVFNGCIYNHRELRKELEGKGHTFVTDHSDTEVLIHGWREWGPRLIEHLEGMYAFAIWDRNAASLMLARDMFGEKPLYVRTNQVCVDWHDDTVVPIVGFSSDVGSLLRIPPQDAVSGDWCRINMWLVPYVTFGYSTGYLPGRQLIETQEELPGSATTFLARGSDTERATFRIETSARSNSEFDVESLVDLAVARRLEADVPLGCFLSGGIDSSLVASFAKRHKPDLMTFSVRMPDTRFDESRFAEVVARQVGTSHTTLEVSPNPAEDLVRLIDLLGQPFGDSSILPTYWVSKAARGHVKVALSGDGGDELFMGYERYVAAPHLAKSWRWLRRLPSASLYRFHPKSRLNKLARMRDMARDYPVTGVTAMEQIFTLSELRDLQPDIHQDDWKCSIEDDHNFDDLLGCIAFNANPNENAALALREFDLENYLAGDLLRKVDTASMACGLEVRCPFLDRDLARAALSMPIEQLMPNGQRKGLLRNIARKYLPKEIVDRPKMGFAIPIGEWFRTDYGGMKTLLHDHLNSAEPFGPISLNRKAVQRFIDEHMRGGRDHGQRLFTLLTLSIWAKQTKSEKLKVES